MSRVRILNGQFDALTLRQTVDAVFGLISAGRRGWLCTVNVAIMMMMRDNARLQNFVERGSLVVADGQPLVWYASLLRKPLPERVTGVELVHAVCERAADEGKRVYLLGATSEVVGEVAGRLRARWPSLQIACGDGYFAPEEAGLRAKGIRAFRADILFVGMGVPRQEIFIEEQWDGLGVGMAIGVGGSFDVLAGVRMRAPLLLQKMGLEWLFRLVQEPRRLFVRYCVTNIQFLWLCLAATIGAGLKPSQPATESQSAADLIESEPETR